LKGKDRWRSNWRVVSPPGAVSVELPRSAARRPTAGKSVRDLPAGTPVVLLARGPGANRRCRRFASRSAVQLDREYLAFPSAAAPGYLVEDAAAPVRAFFKTVLVAPPRTPLSTLIEAGLGILRTLSPWPLMRALAPGRVVVGRRV
jgi:hypothetical protein